jgi:phytoene dehydrogenase-like protein
VAEADEVDWWPSPSTLGRRVVVVGTGVAGMEAAWIAAARGHQVTAFGRSAEVGGKTRLHSLLPGGEPLSGIYDYQFAARATRRDIRGACCRKRDLRGEADKSLYANAATPLGTSSNRDAK